MLDEIPPIVYGGYAVSDGSDSFFELETNVDPSIYDYLAEIKISAEPGNDDIVNFFTSFYPSIEHKYDRVYGLRIVDIINRYQIGNLLKDKRFERDFSKKRYFHRYEYPKSIEYPQGYTNLWLDGIASFVCDNIVEFTWYMSSIKTMQIMMHENYGKSAKRLCVSGTFVSRDKVSDDIFNTFVIKESVSDVVRKEHSDIEEKLRELMSKSSSANSRKLDKIVDEYDSKLKESYNFKFKETFKFVTDLLRTGWEVRDDGFYYKNRIDVFYMNVKGRVYNITEGKYYINDLFVPYGKSIGSVVAHGNHPHIFSHDSLCIGNINRSIENIVHMPELLKTIVVDSGTYSKVIKDPELAKIVGQHM